MTAELRPEWAERVRRLVDEAPPLTPEQRAQLAVLLGGAPDDERPDRGRGIRQDIHVHPVTTPEERDAS